MNLKEAAKKLTDTPGVYLMRGERGKIIYVGKASSLKKRVSSYFRGSAKTAKEELLVKNIRRFDTINTASEAEALILESALIKEHKPKYNIAIKDDKAYPLLRLSVAEKFPRLRIVRRKKKDKSLYFGPYTSAHLLRQAVSFMRRVFPLRTCNVMPRTVCLNYHLKQCTGPCEGKVDEKTYRRDVDNLVMFLRGKKNDLIDKLSKSMKEAAASRNYEEAAVLRDQIESLSSVRGVFSGRRYRVSAQVEELQTVLRLKKEPGLIEGYDISNTSGRLAVGSMVYFRQGVPYKKNYRRFRIRTVKDVDDYAMIREVIERRFSGTLSKELALPDLILIDGGKGHVQCAAEQMHKCGVFVPIISIAKRFEHIYVEWQESPLALPLRSKALKLLMRVRDEAHRFALSYHTGLRKKNMLISELDQIPGIGKKKKMILMKNIDEITGLKTLTVDQLKKIGGIDARTAKNIVEHWKRY